MTGDAAKRTFGENFLLELQKAESRGLLFAVVEDVFIRSTIWRFSSASYLTLIRWRFIRTSWRGCG